ncbi:PREDICTED: regulator of G-protein signaling 22 [Cyprinodon variegatus]|uniref:regulator of G-protein signaling 22 n=1 Tax=Cyprinodon variegatus TaxID=28743 RepID=UPI000742593B|nr:PREDICTED: regulator of G-protein signaling 22 [Cyprinodon variegatus]
MSAPLQCLDREQGIQWIKEKRFPFFLRSDFYHEYRLSKLLLQWNQNFCSNWFNRNVLEGLRCPYYLEDKSAKPGPLEKHRADEKLLKNQADSQTSNVFRRDEEENQQTANIDGAGVDRGRRDTTQTGARVWCCNCGNRAGLDDFKVFLQGRPAEKLLNLWMDVERLRAIQQTERKDRYLAVMRSWYLHSSRRLNVVQLSTLGLTTSPCWTEEKLRSVQPLLMEPLLNYWLPLFWTSMSVHGGRGTETCCFPLSGMKPCWGSTAADSLNPDLCLSAFSPSVFTQMSTTRRSSFGGEIKRMLLCLLVESLSGLYFTLFCEQAGNQLWLNAVYFCIDLQQYHELFHQDERDPYREQREAQLLYSTYIISYARRSINVPPEIGRAVYNRLQPAFEELFDEVEEHALDILLEPWTLLMEGDKKTLQQVCVQEEVRCVDSPAYRELQKLYEASVQQLKQSLPHVQQWESMFAPPSVPPSAPRRYRLTSVLGLRDEVGHFMAFLQKHDASIHLMCWLDLERFRKTSKKDKAFRKERLSQIAFKYLNKNYFFGPDSPATAEQQEYILHWVGGLERMKEGRFSDPVVVGIQEIIRNYMEERWMPLFLSTEEFRERQKQKEKLQTAERFSVHRRKASKAVLKQKTSSWSLPAACLQPGLWWTSTIKIMLFRRALLQPSTCSQFQHFVSLKGNFLENDVRFWVEAQRYKDLYHSHSDLGIIQQKISTIISCFINSSVPPSLQIDILPDQAQRILEQRQQPGPYIFREAQISVFRGLLKFWDKFQQLRRQELERHEEVKMDDDELEDMDGKSLLRQQSQNLMTRSQPPLWCMAGLSRKEALLKKPIQSESSSPRNSDSFADCSIKSASKKQNDRLPSKMSSKQSGREKHQI